MPHDSKGNLLKPGDPVLLRGTVTAITSEQPTHCNITFLTNIGMAAEHDRDPVQRTLLALSARMVELDQPDVIEVPPTDPEGCYGRGRSSEHLPCQFQPGQEVFANGKRGKVTGVNFLGIIGSGKCKVVYTVDIGEQGEIVVASDNVTAAA